MSNNCEHCGTVTRALTTWAEWELLGCICQCHQARQYDKTKQSKRKKGKNER